MPNPTPPPPAPYDPSTLHAPLKPEQRKALITWLLAAVKYVKAQVPAIGAIPDAATLNKATDQELITAYPTIIGWVKDAGAAGPIARSSPISAITNPLSSVVDFLNLLTSAQFWIRAAEVLIGLILLGVGAAHLTAAGPTLKRIPVYGKMIP